MTKETEALDRPIEKLTAEVRRAVASGDHGPGGRAELRRPGSAGMSLLTAGGLSGGGDQARGADTGSFRRECRIAADAVEIRANIPHAAGSFSTMIPDEIVNAD